MLVPSGKNKGRTLELVALRDPRFIQDLLSSEDGDKEHVLLQAEARRLVEVFDRKVFDVRCHGSGCGRLATRCSVYKSYIFNPMWWCDTCDPYQYGSGQYRIRIVRTYHDALDFAEPFGEPQVAEELIQVLAEAKGLSLPLRKDQADVFFNG